MKEVKKKNIKTKNKNYRNLSKVTFDDCRVGLTLNMYFVSMRYTSPTFVASMVNTIASLTFVIAVVLR